MPKDTKAKYLQVRVTEEELALIAQAASDAGEPVSAIAHLLIILGLNTISQREKLSA
jgi:hypothetical protein